MKRAAHPVLSQSGECALARYEQRLRIEEDLSAVTIRNYLSDLRQFAAWCELTWQSGREDAPQYHLDTYKVEKKKKGHPL